jgi:hypothetical protein
MNFTNSYPPISFLTQFIWGEINKSSLYQLPLLLKHYEFNENEVYAEYEGTNYGKLFLYSWELTIKI